MFLFTDGLRVVGEPDGEISHLGDEFIAVEIVGGDCSINGISGTWQMWPRATGIKAELSWDGVSRYVCDGLSFGLK